MVVAASVTAEKQNFFDLHFSELSNSDLCNRQLNYFQSSLDGNALWAREMRDAWGNRPSGTFSGNLFDFGNFDQCINFKHSSESVGDIIGQHCTVLIPFDRRSDKISRLIVPSKK